MGFFFSNISIMKNVSNCDVTVAPNVEVTSIANSQALRGAGGNWWFFNDDSPLPGI